MKITINKPYLTHHAVLAMLSAAVNKAEEMKQPQCIVIVDASGEILGEIRMTGAKFLSRKSARSKALTASSIGTASAGIPENVKLLLATATAGKVTGLPGGLPIIIEGCVVGGVGVGSGTGTQDIEVAEAALNAINAKH